MVVATLPLATRNLGSRDSTAVSTALSAGLEVAVWHSRERGGLLCTRTALNRG